MIGEIVEVMCDHKRSGRRVRDWIDGVVVHADDRMTAVQFRHDVYLTDGWMVPDRILWFSKGTDKLRVAHAPRASAKAKVPARKPAGKPASKTPVKTRH